MSNIIGTIVNVLDFLSYTEKEVTINDAGEKLAFKLSEGRKYFIPSFQREIRWNKENLNVLVQDIKSSNKFLGNVILSKRADKNFDIIDGQQRISVLFMIIHYLSVNWGDNVIEAKEFVPCGLEIESFKEYKKFQDNLYDISKLTSEDQKTDMYNQAKRYGELWLSLKEILGSKDKKYIRELFTNIKRCTLNVILAEQDTTGYNIDYFIDVNLKGVKLDVEDIFKGYLFHMNNSKKTLNNWINIKQSAMSYNQSASSVLNDSNEIYPLVKMLYHYFNCDLYLDNNYTGIKFGADFYLKSDFSNSGGFCYKGEHIIKAINDDTYINSSLEILNKIIIILNDIISNNGPSKNFIALFNNEGTQKVDNDTITIINELTRLLLLNKEITLPYALIMKYFLEIVKTDKKIDHAYAEKFYTIYAFSVLYSLFSTKKEITEIDAVLQSNDWYTELVNKMNLYFSKGKILERKAVLQCKYLPDNEDEVNCHKCKALAILYNFFRIKNGKVSKQPRVSKKLKEFLTNKDNFSIEHFIINDSFKYVTDDEKDTYSLSNEIKKYGGSIFNFIFIPADINGAVLKNFYINHKLELLNDKLDKISCEYSKMVIDTVKGRFDDLPIIGDDNSIDAEKANEYFSYRFKQQFFEMSNTIIQNIMDRVE